MIIINDNLYRMIMLILVSMETKVHVSGVFGGYPQCSMLTA